MYRRISDVLGVTALGKHLAVVALAFCFSHSASAQGGGIPDAILLMSDASGVETPYTWGGVQPIIEPPDTSSSQTAKNPRVATDTSGIYVAAFHTGDAKDDNTTPAASSRIYVSKSISNGNSWEDPVEIPAIPGAETPYAFRPDVQTDWLGTYVMTYDAYVNGASRVYTSVSLDDGDTWEDPAELSIPGITGGHSTSVDADGDGTWFAAYIAQVGDSATSSVVVARSDDDGATWELASTISPALQGRPQIKFNYYSGITVVVYEKPGAGHRDIGYAVSEDYGDSFVTGTVNTDFATDSRNDYHPRIDFSANDSYVVVWGGRSTVSSTHGVYSARADFTEFNGTDGGLVWSAPETITTQVNFPSDRDVDPWVGTDQIGNWISAWGSADIFDPEIPREIYSSTSYNDGTTWTVRQSLDSDFSEDNITRFANPVLGTNLFGHWLAMWINRPPTGSQSPDVTTAVPWYTTTFLSTGEGDFADVSITGQVLTNPIYQTQNFQVRYTIRNNGPLTANNLVVQLLPPAPPVFPVSVTGPPEFVLVDDGSTVPYRPQGTIESLEPGESVVIIATFNSADPGTYTIESQVTADEIDPLESNNLGVETTVVIQPAPVIADLQVTKTAYPHPVAEAGKYLGFTITVRNLSNTVAPSVVVTDPIPDSLNFNYAATSQGTWATTSANGRTTVTASLGAIGPGARATFVIATTPKSTHSSATNTACATHPGLDPDPGNNCGSVSVTWEGGGGGGDTSDVSIVKTASAAQVTQGSTLTYTLTARNHGPAAATGVTISDTLPDGMNYQSESHSSNATVTRNGQQITADVGNLAVDEEAFVNISVVAMGTETIYNTATVAVTSPDNDMSNNTSTRSVYVDPVDPSTLANLNVRKTAAPSPGTVGVPMVYTVEVGNFGPAEATNVVMQDLLPEEVAFQGAVVLDEAFGTETSYSNGRVIYHINSIPVDTTATIDITVMPLVSGSITNTASAFGEQSDLQPSNNTGSVTTTINPGTAPPTQADLSTTATVSPTTGDIGNALVLTLQAHNYGPQSAANILVTHTLNSSTTLVSATGPDGDGTVVGNQVQVPITVLGPGVTKAVTITLVPQLNGVLTLDGSISGNVVDPVSANNTSSVNVQIGTPFTNLQGFWVKVSNKTRNQQVWKVKGKFYVKNNLPEKLPYVAVYFYLSDDDQFDPGDSLISAYLYKKIKPGKQKAKTAKLKPTTDLAGKYLIGVIDRDGVNETIVPVEIPPVP